MPHPAPPRMLQAPSPGPMLLGVLLFMPWLWRWAPGPSSQVVPLLAAWGCTLAAAVTWLLSAPARRATPEVAAASWLAAAACSSAIGLLQWFGLEGGLPGIQASAPGEAFGQLRQRNQFASLTSIGLVVALCLHARARTATLRMLLAGVTVLLAMGCAASLSRTGLLQWTLVCGVALLRPGSRRFALGALAAYGAGVVGLPAALQAWQGIEAGSLMGRLEADLGCASRRVLWSNVLHLIAQRPLAGWGMGELDYAHYATLYPGARFCDILDNAHNLPLHLAVEFGVPAALLACGALAWAVWRARPWAERRPQRVMAWGVLAVIGLHSGLEYPLWYGPFQLAVGVALVVLAGVVGPVPQVARAGGVALALGAGAALLWSVARYHEVSQAYLPPEQRREAFRIDPLRGVRPGPFTGQAEFAVLALTPLSPASAEQVHALAGRLLHFSPEPRVIEARIESAVMLGEEEDALWHLARFRAAFPSAHAAWARRSGAPAAP